MVALLYCAAMTLVAALSLGLLLGGSAAMYRMVADLRKGASARKRQRVLDRAAAIRGDTLAKARHEKPLAATCPTCSGTVRFRPGVKAEPCPNCGELVSARMGRKLYGAP